MTGNGRIRERERHDVRCMCHEQQGRRKPRVHHLPTPRLTLSQSRHLCDGRRYGQPRGALECGEREREQPEPALLQRRSHDAQLAQRGESRFRERQSARVDGPLE